MKDDNALIHLNKYDRNKEALLLYTSGTSGSPKGVVITFKNLISSIETMCNVWQWSPNDHILNTLPLNHYSGLVYCLLTPHYLGARVDLMPKFNAKIVWSKLLDKNNSINTFIGVPTIFNQLIDYYHLNLHEFNRQSIGEDLKSLIRNKFRFIGSGSAPLNVKIYNDWLHLTNYSLLERYGMTEIGK
jgi:malonyl-CoA/methylmalonyl-CoA synthetase